MLFTLPGLPWGLVAPASDLLRSVTSQAKGSVSGARFSPADAFLSGNSRQALLKAQAMEGRGCNSSKQYHAGARRPDPARAKRVLGESRGCASLDRCARRDLKDAGNPAQDQGARPCRTRILKNCGSAMSAVKQDRRPGMKSSAALEKS